MELNSKIWKLKLSPTEFVVLCYILAHKTEEELFDVNRDKIAIQCGVSEPTVTRAFKTLEKINVVKIYRRQKHGLSNLIKIQNHEQWIVIQNEGWQP